MIDSVSLWHVIPIDLGVQFLDPTSSALEVDEALYVIVNDPNIKIAKQSYSDADYHAICFMRSILGNIQRHINAENGGGKQIKFSQSYPLITGCIAQYDITSRLSCFIMVNGTAVFFERGKNIKVEDEQYFALSAFYERQRYEDDFCYNRDDTEYKADIYHFINLLRDSIGKAERQHSASNNFRIHGISYVLCITVINIPDLVSNKIDIDLRKNIRALLETSAFSNIYNRAQWNIIKERIKNDNYTDIALKPISENMIFADSWSGVVMAGDVSRNQKCLQWLMKFEILLQSNWLLFDALAEDVVRQEMTSVQLQSILNQVEFAKVKIDNDISSNVEQWNLLMRNSLIDSSNINTIYSRMHGMLTNKIKLKKMAEERQKGRFAIVSDISLMVIALLQIYGVIKSLISQSAWGEGDIITLSIISILALIFSFFIIRGRK